MVGINVLIPVPMAYFFGWRPRCSGTPRPRHRRVNFFTRMKAITTRWQDLSVRTDGLNLSSQNI